MSRYVICAVGNSHMAAAKLGWDGIAAEFPDYAFEFFGFPPPSSTEFDAHTKVVGRSIVAETEFLQRGFRLTSGGKTEIRGTDYSAYVTIGMGLGGPTSIVKGVCVKHRLVQHAERGSMLLSKAFLTAAIDEAVRSEISLSPFRSIRAISSAPVFFQSIPAPTVHIMKDPAFARSAVTCPGLHRDVSRLFASRCMEKGSDFYRYLAQPECTLDESGLTKDEFIRDGIGFATFSGKAKRNNVNHGNKSYGTVLMRQLLQELQQTKLRPRAELQ